MATGFAEWWDTYVVLKCGGTVLGALVAVVLVAAILMAIVLACRRAALQRVGWEMC